MNTRSHFIPTYLVIPTYPMWKFIFLQLLYSSQVFFLFACKYKHMDFILKIKAKPDCHFTCTRQMSVFSETVIENTSELLKPHCFGFVILACNKHFHIITVKQRGHLTMYSSHSCFSSCKGEINRFLFS